MTIRLLETRLGLRNSVTRIPFRYGKACLTRCPQAILEAVIETGGKIQRGYSGDCLPPSWFDKSPQKNFRQQIDEMLASIAQAEAAFADELRQPGDFFSKWLAVNRRLHGADAGAAFPPLLVSFGISMVERAIMDAMARAANISFHRAARENLFGLRPGEVHLALAGREVAEWLPPQPLDSIYVRHTVGLSDPLTAADIGPDERLNDGFPQSLEEYVQQTGLRYFKIKVSNRLDHDLQRLAAIASLIERHRGGDYRLTLDGNEQYPSAESFDALIAAIVSRPELQTLWANTLLIEQPLARDIALDERHTAGIRRLSQTKPVIIDESDGRLDSFARAAELGYRGVSSKTCKGPIKSLLNAGLVWLKNDGGRRTDFVLTGEDLCTVGIVPVQTDLCLTATLGIEHVERNGHHYHPGLSYLPNSQQQAALAAHGDLYQLQHGRISPRLINGRFHIASLHCPGFGFAVPPDLSAYTPASAWDFSSLQLPAE